VNPGPGYRVVDTFTAERNGEVFAVVVLGRWFSTLEFDVTPIAPRTRSEPDDA
jgi:hypothetical protein